MALLLLPLVQWAHLPGAELARRERVLRRQCQLSARQQALMEQHWRHQCEADELKRQLIELSEQQRALQEELDPEQAAAWRRQLAAAQRGAELARWARQALAAAAGCVALMALGAVLAGEVVAHYL